MVMTAARISHGWVASERVNSSASPEKTPDTLLGIAISRSAAAIASTASLSEAPGARLKLIVTAGNWSWCWMTRGAVRRSTLATELSGTWAPALDGTYTRESAAGSVWYWSMASSTTRY